MWERHPVFIRRAKNKNKELCEKKTENKWNWATFLRIEIVKTCNTIRTKGGDFSAPQKQLHRTPNIVYKLGSWIGWHWTILLKKTCSCYAWKKSPKTGSSQGQFSYCSGLLRLRTKKTTSMKIYNNLGRWKIRALVFHIDSDAILFAGTCPENG